MTEKTWHQQLREPFPREVVGRLPKGGAMLDYVGHAAVTDRLLSVDPEWTWEPMGYTPTGLPALDDQGNLWIRLTIHGHTRLGVGDGRSMKEKIGDAIRNGAMRFGVALDLWTKDELESGGSRPAQSTPAPQTAERFAAAALPDEDQRAWLDSVEAQTDLAALEALWDDARGRGVPASVPGFQQAVSARKRVLQDG